MLRRFIIAKDVIHQSCNSLQILTAPLLPQVKTWLDDWRASAASQGTGDAESNQDASSGSQEANTDEQPNKASGWAGKLKSGLAGMFSSVKSDAPPTEQTPLTADQSPASEKKVPKAATYV